MSSHTFVSDSWRPWSNCRGIDPELFFADKGRISNSALEPCRSCSVRDSCLEFAINSPWEPFGVWGGLQAQQVRQMWRRRQAAIPSKRARDGDAPERGASR